MACALGRGGCGICVRQRHARVGGASAYGRRVGNRERLLDIEKRIYLWALAGFVAFSGLSRLRSAPAGALRSIARLYSGTIAGYALYVLLIGYLLVRREDTICFP